VCTHPVSEKYTLFDIAESRFYSAPPDLPAAFNDPTSKRGEERGRDMLCSRYEKFLVTPQVLTICNQIQKGLFADVQCLQSRRRVED